MHCRPDRSRVLIALGVMCLQLTACASGGGAANGRRSRDDADGGAPLSMRVPTTTVMLVLAHTTDLGITPTQLAGLAPVRRHLDSLDAPLYARLDSLRTTQRPANPRDLSEEQRATLRARRVAIADLVTRFRDSNSETRPRVMALLSSDQQEKLASLESEARRAEADADQPTSTNSGQDGRRGGRGRRGGGMGGMGRPLVD
jgi:hypothetical protein